MTKRRKTFYPYSDLMDSIIFKLSVADQGKIPIIDDDLDIEIASTLNRAEEIDAWDDIFQIKSRYISEIKNKIDTWIDDYLVLI